MVENSGAKAGSRQIWGIAYNAANHGERKRVTCSEEVWNNPDNRVFYADESVCLTVDELRGLDLRGVPMRVQHKTDLPPVGQILGNWVDKEGRLWIHAEVPSDTPYHRAMIGMIDNGTCSDLSISYGVERNPETGEVYHDSVDEISFVAEGHFRGCRVGVKASNSTFDKVPAPRTEFRFVIASSSSSPSGPTMSAQLAPPSTAAAAAASTSPSLEDLMQQNTKTAHERLKALEELEKTKKELEQIAKELNERKEAEAKAQKEKEDAERAAKEQYKKEHMAEAEEVVKYMAEQLLESGVQLDDSWKQFNKDMLTETNPIARQSAAVQIACAKKIKCQAQALAEKEATIKKLTQNMQMAEMINRVADADGEADRYEDRRKRSVAAGAQQKKAEPQQQQQQQRKVADWCVAMMGNGYQMPQQQQQWQQAQPQQRPVNAAAQGGGARIGKSRKNEEEEKETQDEEELSSKKVSAAGSFVPRPMREGYPVNPHSFRNCPRSQGFWEHAVDVYHNTLSFENSNKHHAGFDFTQPL